MKVLLETMTWTEIEEAIKKAEGIIVPFGSVEEHGPHLPVSTDTIITLELVSKAAEETGFLVAPTLNYGVCRSTRSFPGTISLKFETLKQVTIDILSELVECGFKRIVLFSFHASNAHLTAIKEAAYSFTIRNRSVKVFFVSSLDFASENIPKILETLPQHACEAETSLMLFLKPELVHMDKATDEVPQSPPFLVTPTGRPWMKTGVMGYPTKATKEKGEQLFTLMVNRLIEILNIIKNQ
ncbi:MAG: creatininase family protein [Candidatus Freyarchaeota archaeon]|nr:creatininase family protein [Candidatus Freyrarchaeum guaymaensis]HDO81094.1 creatininase family protein [Candidatus Bathyarchaeota archaeon]